MSRYQLFDRSAIDLRGLAERGHDLTWQNCRTLDAPIEPFEATGFGELVERIVTARRNGRPVIVFMGGHPIKLGLSRYVIDLIERRIVTHVATNGAGLIHDFELALVGGTSEDVARWIKIGQFGLWQETSRLNEIICEAAERGEGLGEGVGRAIAQAHAAAASEGANEGVEGGESALPPFSRAALPMVLDETGTLPVSSVLKKGDRHLANRNFGGVLMCRSEPVPVFQQPVSRATGDATPAGPGSTAPLGLAPSSSVVDLSCSPLRRRGDFDASSSALSFAHPELSIAATGWRTGTPVTSHVTVGGDIIHAMPNCNGGALGQASDTDFLIFARSLQDLEGGVFLNIGSAVTGPEVYLKALSMARNVARQRSEDHRGERLEGREHAATNLQSEIRIPQSPATPPLPPLPKRRQISVEATCDGVRPCHFTTAVFDLVPLPDNWREGTPSKDDPFYYYRPWKTILVRTVQDGGTSFYFHGDHRRTIPALWQALSNAGGLVDPGTQREMGTSAGFGT